jgi:hypothetical protein
MIPATTETTTTSAIDHSTAISNNNQMSMFPNAASPKNESTASKQKPIPPLTPKPSLLQQLRSLNYQKDIKPHLTPINLIVAFFGAVIFVSGSILFMLLVGWIKCSTKDELDFWIEVNSQILNGCFTLSAICVAPSRMLNLYRLVVYTWITRSQRNQNSPSPPRALTLADRIETIYHPLLLDPRKTGPSSTPTADELALQPLRTWYILILLLNFQCIFQWPITVAMWGWAPNYWERPSVIVYGFLPLSFLCGTVGGVWLGMLGGKVKRLQKERDEKEGMAEGEKTDMESTLTSVVEV